MRLLIAGALKLRNNLLISRSRRRSRSVLYISSVTEEERWDSFVVHETERTIMTMEDLNDYTIIKEGEAEILMHAKNEVFYNKTQVLKSFFRLILHGNDVFAVSLLFLS